MTLNVNKRYRMTPKINETCQRCGFVPTYMCQLDIVHIDGCSEDNDPSNYMTLCLNCQRLKEAMKRDHLSPAEAADLRDIWRKGYLFN